jgi:hypothetical protein
MYGGTTQDVWRRLKMYAGVTRPSVVGAPPSVPEALNRLDLMEPKPPPLSTGGSQLRDPRFTSGQNWNALRMSDTAEQMKRGSE